ncbi:TIGR03086 family metal-binding protein [Streptomyces hydrogenans]
MLTNIDGGGFDRLRHLHARVIRETVNLARRVTPDDLARPTPCAGWDLRDLLDHMTAQHHGFAAAAQGYGADPEHWKVTGGEYEEAAELVVAAFADVDDADRPFALPEFGTGRTFTARRAIGFHFLDHVVHGWDVAHTLGLPYDPGPDVLDIALPIARSVPDDGSRSAPGSPFAPALATSEDAAPLTRLLAVLGRSADAAC